MKKILLLLLLMVSTSCFAWSLFGPKNYEECLLENMKGVTSDKAAQAIEYACDEKFNSQEKQVKCKLQDFTSTEYNLLQATANITDYGWFKGNIYNGSQKTIREILIEYKSKKNKYVEYKITGLNIKPLTSDDFLTEVHDKDITKLEWNYTVKGCD